MKRIFTWQFVLISFILTVITYVVVNGPIVGTGHLQAVVPGVVIPDLTPTYSSDQLPGFFQAMGNQGRAAYITVNNFDFLFIISNGLFGVSAIGTMLRFLMKNKTLATWLALLGLLPGFFDAVESICFRLIVMSPYNDHLALSQVAAVATKAKFAGYNAVLVVIITLLVVTLIMWAKGRRKAHPNN